MNLFIFISIVSGGLLLFIFILFFVVFNYEVNFACD